jgi:DNA repair exonuclease SbcCD ATPase subunit
VALVSVVEEKIKLVQTEKERLDKIQEDLKTISQKFESLESKATRLESKEEDIEVSVDTITKTKEFIANLEKRTEILRDSVGEIKGIEEDIKKRIALIEQKTAGLKENEKLADELLTRFKSMDALVLDIETRTKQLQNAREWLAGTESRLTSISDNAERLVAELKALLEKERALGIASSLAGTTGSGSSGGDQFSKGRGGSLSRESETKVKTVLTLFDQKWTIPEICKVTKMSRGEVELILELNNR